jgi:hypothetical protein
LRGRVFAKDATRLKLVPGSSNVKGAVLIKGDMAQLLERVVHTAGFV